VGDEVPAGRLKDRIVVGRGRPLGARCGDRIERAAPLVVIALRHLAPQGEELAALGHLHEDTRHTERTELVRDRAIRAAATSCCLRHRVTFPRVGLTVKSEAARVASIASSDGGMSMSRLSMKALRPERTRRFSLCLRLSRKPSELGGSSSGLGGALW